MASTTNTTLHHNHDCVNNELTKNRPSPIVSLFTNVKLPAPVGHMSLEACILGIRNGEHALAIENLRAAPLTSGSGELTQQEHKKGLRAFTPACQCWYRKSDCVTSLSGVAVFDFDDVEHPEELRKKLSSMPWAYAVFISPSGTGVKLFVRTPEWVFSPADYVDFMCVAMDRVSLLAGATVDPSGRDPVRLCLVSHDPAAHLNTDAKPFPMTREETARVIPAPRRPGVPSVGGFGVRQSRPELRERVKWAAEALAHQYSGRPDYATWIRIISAVGEVYGV